MTRRGIFGLGGGEGSALLPEPSERGLGIDQVRILAAQIGQQLGQPPLGLPARRDNLRELVLESVAALGQSLQFGLGLSPGATQRRQRRFGHLVSAPFGQGARRCLGHVALGGGKLGGAVFGLAFGREPAGVKQQRLVAANLVAEAAVALRLTRLLLQGREPRRQGSGHVVEPREIVFGGGELEFGLASAGVKSGGAGGLFEQEPAFGRLGLDQRADASLTDDRPGRPASRSIGE